MDVILDTNFLLLPYQYRIDIFRQLEELVEQAHFIAPQSVQRELQRLMKEKGKRGAAARLALKILGIRNVEIIATEVSADRWIYEYAKAHRCIVCTNDAALRQRIKRLRRKCIVLRRRNRIGWAEWQ